ncbi:hypothetical protein GCM10019998_02720 [Tetragenococcus solitarius]|uniref:Uncharacterized protein n=2 Tax=Tetragenococcus solitarius TaxID=71453 RepID=A0ABP6KKD8_9ENTE
MSNMKKGKICWTILVLLDAVLLLCGFIYKNWVLSLMALGLILMVRIFAYDLLFKSFDEKWDKKRKDYVRKERRKLKK